nr:immunoglobulin light chain junction region [Macaca mulatta]
CQHGHETPLTF